MNDLLANVFWHALRGPQARHAIGNDHAQRYAAGFSPIAAFADVARPDFDALAPFCAPGEALYTAGWSGPLPTGWKLVAEGAMFQMVWDAPAPESDEAIDAVPLLPAHAALALDLATLTRPGPFGPRTIELGDYVGLFEGDRLLAMAGERAQAGRLREVSGVCTHPDAQGRGHARRLMRKLIRREMQRGETPFLHVMRDNASAWGLYERMGFRRHAELAVRVVARG